jgi:outer membrane biosynthesis protein TonB
MTRLREQYQRALRLGVVACLTVPVALGVAVASVPSTADAASVASTSAGSLLPQTTSPDTPVVVVPDPSTEPTDPGTPEEPVPPVETDPTTPAEPVPVETTAPTIEPAPAPVAPAPVRNPPRNNAPAPVAPAVTPTETPTPTPTATPTPTPTPSSNTPRPIATPTVWGDVNPVVYESGDAPSSNGLAFVALIVAGALLLGLGAWLLYQRIWGSPVPVAKDK